MKFCQHGSNFRRKFQAVLKYAFRDKNTPFPPFREGLRVIGHSMSIENLILGVNRVTVSYLIHYDSLLQNAANFTNFIFYTTAILQQNATEVHYKMRQLLQIATILLQNATFITKCDVCYKSRQYSANCVLQNCLSTHSILS